MNSALASKSLSPVRLWLARLLIAYERLGLDDLHYEILGLRVPLLRMPVGPGRNVVAVEAIKQCGSPWLPRIEPPLTPGEFLARNERFDLPLVASLQPGSRLQLRAHGSSLNLVDTRGCAVARLSQAACESWRERVQRIEEVRVLALVRRERTDEQPAFRDRCRCDRWEVPLVEVVYRGGSEPTPG